MTCVVVVPVLHRPHRVEPLVASIDKATTTAHRVLFVCSPHDEAEQAAITKAGGEWICTDVDHARGDYAQKINLAYRATWEPYLFLGADDLAFHPYWLERALDKMTEGIGVVGTNDLGSPRVMAGTHATHSLVTREYVDHNGTIDEPHKVLHEGYWHEFVDDEFIGTAKHRHAYAFAADSHVEHLHPAWGKAPVDELYAQQPRRMTIGRRVYERRRHLWA